MNDSTTASCAIATRDTQSRSPGRVDRRFAVASSGRSATTRNRCLDRRRAAATGPAPGRPARHARKSRPARRPRPRSRRTSLALRLIVSDCNSVQCSIDVDPRARPASSAAAPRGGGAASGVWMIAHRRPQHRRSAASSRARRRRRRGSAGSAPGASVRALTMSAGAGAAAAAAAEQPLGFAPRQLRGARHDDESRRRADRAAARSAARIDFDTSTSSAASCPAGPAFGTSAARASSTCTHSRAARASRAAAAHDRSARCRRR